MEIELKLAASPAHLHKVMHQRLLEHLVSGAPAHVMLAARYFDTDKCDLHQRGLALRVRRQGGGWMQTLKLDHRADGALERYEWETELAGPDPDLDALRRQAGLPARVARLLREVRRGLNLEEKFAVDVKRESWQLRIADSEVEMALDEGSISCGGSRMPVAEIEFELKAGDKAALYAVAAELAGHMPLQVSELSKSARGYALCLGQSPAPRKAEPIGLSSRMTVGEGIRAILGNCLRHAQANAHGVLDSDDPEYLHQMRVGLRRFRSATRLFSTWTVLPPALQEELAWLGTVLGSARDHDVLFHSTLPAIIDDLPAEESLQPLAERAGAAAAEKRAELRRALHSARCGQCMLALFGWVDCSGWRNGIGADLAASLDKPLRRFARRAVARGHAKIEQRGQDLHRHDSEALHRLRIACKQNRYAVEFFCDIERGKRAAQYVKALSSLQDTLGMRNDVTVALGLIDALKEGLPALAVPAAFASGYLNCRATAGLRDVRKPWAQFATLSPSRLFN